MTERPHGYARYRLDGCRCYVCGWARARYDDARNRRITAGTWQPFTDAQPVREHLAALAATGMGQRRIAQLAGISHGALTGLLRGRRGNPPSARVRRETADAVLAVTPGPAGLAPNAVIDGTGTARRVQALCCIGWTLTEQARHVGWLVSNYAGLTAGHPVTARNARLVAGLYDQLSMTPAPAGHPSARARRFAAGKGWAPPLAWDDDTIDDPKARPVGYTGQPKREPVAEFAAAYRQVAAPGLTNRQMAEQLGITVGALKARRARAIRNGLLEAAA